MLHLIHLWVWNMLESKVAWSFSLPMIRDRFLPRPSRIQDIFPDFPSFLVSTLLPPRKLMRWFRKHLNTPKNIKHRYSSVRPQESVMAMQPSISRINPNTTTTNRKALSRIPSAGSFSRNCLLWIIRKLKPGTKSFPMFFLLMKRTNWFRLVTNMPTQKKGLLPEESAIHTLWRH